MYVFIESEPGVFTVGFFSPETKWYAESDYTSPEEAIARMRYLNGASEVKTTRAKPAPKPEPAKK